MQHERNGLHLNRSGCEVAGSGNVSLEVGWEKVVLVEIIKRSNGIRNIGTAHIDLVSITESIGLGRDRQPVTCIHAHNTILYHVYTV